MQTQPHAKSTPVITAVNGRALKWRENILKSPTGSARWACPSIIPRNAGSARLLLTNGEFRDSRKFRNEPAAASTALHSLNRLYPQQAQGLGQDSARQFRQQAAAGLQGCVGLALDRAGVVEAAEGVRRLEQVLRQLVRAIVGTDRVQSLGELEQLDRERAFGGVAELDLGSAREQR